uniref:Uncharacterized protein n=1 Tax=Arundo donax TaxID=35708 RepID=A0A0A8YF88_ARUDO
MRKNALTDRTYEQREPGRRLI